MDSVPTPRRSSRKIVKPRNDYEDIVNQSLCHRKKSECEMDIAAEPTNPEQPKTTQPKVGRVSQNRSRKTLRAILDENENGVGNGTGNAELKPSDIQNPVQKEVTMKDDCETEVGDKEKSNDLMNKTVAASEGGQDASNIAINIASNIVLDDEGQWNVEVLEDSELEVNTLDSIPTEITRNASFTMERLFVSDDEEKQDSTPTVVINAVDLSKSIVTTPLTKQDPKAGRFPTPYKAEISDLLNPDKEEQNENDISNGEEHFCELPVVTITAPRDNILRSIRKRSLSLCLGNDAVRSQREPSTVNRVTFHSPANRTALIKETDFSITASTQNITTEDENKQTPSNVTKRRKRSMSIDDGWLGVTRKPLSNTTGRSQIITPSKLLGTPQKALTTRTKLPNFAAIHEKQFNQMENLVDHVARKAERAKILNNSLVKLVSAQKRAAVIAENSAPKPTASKRINLDAAVSAIPVFKPRNLLTAVKRAPEKSKDATELGEINELTLGATGVPMPVKSSTAKVAAKLTTGISKTVPMEKTAPKAVATLKKPLTIVQAVAKPAFNLSTAVPTEPLQYLQNAPPPQPAATGSAPAYGFAPTQVHEDKVASRRLRHVKMFKERGGVGTQTTRQQAALIRGVRTNRRFDLQMQHRRLMDENN